MLSDNVIEKFILGKKEDQSLCEDIIVESENYYAVIDGVTSKSSKTYNGMSGGRYGALLVANAIRQLEGNETAEIALKKLDDSIFDQYRGALPSPDERIQACAVIYSKVRREVWSYGDCALMINGKAYTHEKKIDQILGGFRSLIIHLHLMNGGNADDLIVNDFGREAIMPYMKKQSLFANADHVFGYPVIDGSGINASMIKIYTVNEGDEIVLASDGYPVLCPTLEESERELKKILKSDPLSINENIQTKMMVKGNISFDDRSYLRFKV